MPSAGNIVPERISVSAAFYNTSVMLEIPNTFHSTSVFLMIPPDSLPFGRVNILNTSYINGWVFDWQTNCSDILASSPLISVAINGVEIPFTAASGNVLLLRQYVPEYALMNYCDGYIGFEIFLSPAYQLPDLYYGYCNITVTAVNVKQYGIIDNHNVTAVIPVQIELWASSVITCYSEYSSTGRSCKQILGPPNSFSFNNNNSWTPEFADGYQSIIVEFDGQLFVDEVVVRIDSTPGFIAEIGLLVVEQLNLTYPVILFSTQMFGSVDPSANLGSIQTEPMDVVFSAGGRTDFLVFGLVLTINEYYFNNNEYEFVDAIAIRGMPFDSSYCLPGNEESDTQVLVDWLGYYPPCENWAPGTLACNGSSRWSEVSCSKSNRIIGLDLGNECSLNGTIPPFISKLNALTSLSLCCNFYGTIPSEIGLLTNLVSFEASSNFLTGSLPIQFYNLNALTIVQFYFNYITGTISTNIGNLINLEVIGVYNNYLSGTIPCEIGLLYNMNTFVIYNNMFSDAIPSEIGYLASMQYFQVDGNVLTALPTEIGLLTSLNQFTFSTNDISGHLVSEIGLMTNMIVFNAAFNSFSGTIPTELGLLQQILEFDLSYNSFTGTVPSEMGNLMKMTAISLASNSFVSTLPSEFGMLTQLLLIDVSNNHFTGQLPDYFSIFLEVESFYASWNSFSGQLPNSWESNTNLKNLEINNSGLLCDLPTLCRMNLVSIPDTQANYAGIVLQPSRQWNAGVLKRSPIIEVQNCQGNFNYRYQCSIVPRPIQVIEATVSPSTSVKTGTVYGTSEAAVNGLAIFSNLEFQGIPGESYTIQFSILGIPNTESSSLPILVPFCSQQLTNSIGDPNDIYECACDVGYYKDGLNAACLPCLPNSFKAHSSYLIDQSDIGILACISCPANRWTAGAFASKNASDCVCVPGMEIDPSTSECSCPPGTFIVSNAGGSQNRCSPCPQNTYRSGFTNTDVICSFCDTILSDQSTESNHKITLSSGSTSENDCVCASKYYPIETSSGAIVCEPCSKLGTAAICVGQLTSTNVTITHNDVGNITTVKEADISGIQPNYGYWLSVNPIYFIHGYHSTNNKLNNKNNNRKRSVNANTSSNNTKDSNNNLNVKVIPYFAITSCPYKQACPGYTPGLSVNENCEIGYEGPACGVCSVGYGHLGQQCAICPANSVSIFLVILIISLIALGCTLLVTYIVTMADKVEKAREAGEDTQLQNAYVSGIKIVITHFQILGFLSDFDVIWPDALKRVFAIPTSSATVSSASQNIAIDCAVRPNLSSQVVFIFILPLILFFGTLIGFLFIYFLNWRRNMTNEESYKRLVTKVSQGTIALLYVAHPGIIKSVLNFMVCHKVGIKSFAVSDMSVDCSSPSFIAIRTFCALYLIFYGFGGLAAIYFVIKRDHLKHPFLCSSYLDKYFYWDIVVTLRKIVFVALSLFASSVEQLFFGIIILYGSHLVQKHLKPFYNHYANIEEEISFGILLITLLTGMLFYTRSLSSISSETVVAILLMFINFSVIFAIIILPNLSYAKKKVEKFNLARHTTTFNRDSINLSHNNNNNNNNNKNTEATTSTTAMIPLQQMGESTINHQFKDDL